MAHRSVLGRVKAKSTPQCSVSGSGHQWRLAGGTLGPGWGHITPTDEVSQAASAGPFHSAGAPLQWWCVSDWVQHLRYGSATAPEPETARQTGRDGETD